MKVRLDYASASQSGDYFQVMFKAEEDGEDAEYLLIQRQFEDPDGGRCNVESHDENFTGHFRVLRAVLHRNRFAFVLDRETESEVEVLFEVTGRIYDEVSRVLRIMIPCLVVSDSSGAC